MSKKINSRFLPKEDTCFMSLAFFYSRLSPDPYTQIGSVIIGNKKEPIAFGFNQLLPQFESSSFDWKKSNKEKYVRPAELVALDKCNVHGVSGCTLYVTAVPSLVSLNQIAAYKISRVCFYPFKHPNSNSILNSKDRLDAAEAYVKGMIGLSLDCFTGDLNWLRDEVMNMKHSGVFDTSHCK